MENQNEHLEQLAEIRSLMEKSSRFLSLSGLSGIVAGVAALLGAAWAYSYLGNSFYFPEYSSYIFEPKGSVKLSFVEFLLLDGFAVLTAAIGFGLFFTVRKAKKQKIQVWNNSARRLFINLLIPLLVGGIFSLLLLYHGEVYLLGAVTLIFYGLALINASKYTLEDIRYLGISEIILGLLCAFFVGYSLLFWAVGFGVLHIIYGALMYFKYERSES